MSFSRIKVLIVLGCLLVLSVPAQAAREGSAAQFTGAYLIHVCSSDSHGREIVPGGHIACQAYISGIIDYHNLMRAFDMPPTVNFCIPKSVSLNEMQEVVLRYLKQNGQHDGFTAAPGVAIALYGAYPCK